MSMSLRTITSAPEGGAAETVTAAQPVTPGVAWTRAQTSTVPPAGTAPGAVYSPPAATVPAVPLPPSTPATDHRYGPAAPALIANCWVWFTAFSAVAGERVSVPSGGSLPSACT